MQSVLSEFTLSNSHFQTLYPSTVGLTWLMWICSCILKHSLCSLNSLYWIHNSGLRTPYHMARVNLFCMSLWSKSLYIPPSSTFLFLLPTSSIYCSLVHTNTTIYTFHLPSHIMLHSRVHSPMMSMSLFINPYQEYSRILARLSLPESRAHCTNINGELASKESDYRYDWQNFQW